MISWGLELAYKPPNKSSPIRFETWDVTNQVMAIPLNEFGTLICADNGVLVWHSWINFTQGLIYFGPSCTELHALSFRTLVDHLSRQCSHLSMLSIRVLMPNNTYLYIYNERFPPNAICNSINFYPICQRRSLREAVPCSNHLAPMITPCPCRTGALWSKRPIAKRICAGRFVMMGSCSYYRQKSLYQSSI